MKLLEKWPICLQYCHVDVDEVKCHTYDDDAAIWALTHWGRVTHICVSKLTIIGSDNSLAPGRRQAIIWTNAGILLIGPLGANFSEILIEILTFSFKKMWFKVSSAKWRPFCLGLNVLIILPSPLANSTRWKEALYHFLILCLHLSQLKLGSWSILESIRESLCPSYTDICLNVSKHVLLWFLNSHCWTHHGVTIRVQRYSQKSNLQKTVIMPFSSQWTFFIILGEIFNQKSSHMISK